MLFPLARSPAGSATRLPVALLYTVVFGIFMVAVLCGVVYLGVTRDRSLRAYHLVLITGALLVAAPVLGPGYAPQYAWWWIAVVPLSSLSADRPDRLPRAVRGGVRDLHR